MMRQLFAAIAAILVWTGLAAADTPYTVVGVPIDATADNALEAQTIAMRRGQVAAVHVLVQRLTLPEDRLQIPEITNEEAAQMISGLQVRNEQRSATRYLGELTVSFDPRAVRSWLNGLGVPFVEGQAREILVLPVLQTASGNYWLWNTTDPETGEVHEQPWLMEWRTGGYQHALSPVSAPSGDAGRMLIDGNSAAQMNGDQLRSVAQAYGVSRVAVMIARQGGGVRVDGRLFSFDGAGEVTSQQIPTLATNTFRGAATRFVTDLENAWKAEAIVRGGGAESLNVTVLYNSLAEWLRLQNAITGTSLIRSAQLDAIAPTGAMMTLEFRGQFGQLQRELDARGARLVEDPDLGLVVRSR